MQLICQSMSELHNSQIVHERIQIKVRISSAQQNFLTSMSTFLDDVKEWSGPFFDAQQLGVRLNFDVDAKSAVQTDEVTQCENRLTSPCFQGQHSGTNLYGVGLGLK